MWPTKVDVSVIGSVLLYHIAKRIRNYNSINQNPFSIAKTRNGTFYRFPLRLLPIRIRFEGYFSMFVLWVPLSIEFPFVKFHPLICGC